ncbi:MAG: Wzz/FepE/Etk N-terminal domain-containing protein [Bacteroidia bacterium]|nr:Wzz/FepE/Etk N-terminal domain-containing protein [Bacteroidia bacterium]
MKQPSPQTTLPSTEDEIDLLALAQKIWKGRAFVLQTVAICTILGIAIALITPAEYSASSTIVPQLGDSNTKLGGLGGLAALAGLNVDMAAQSGIDLSPVVYPQIASSIPFQLELMNTPLNFKVSDNSISLFDYLTKFQKQTILGTIKKYTLGLPGILSKLLQGEKAVTIDSSNNELTPLKLTDDQVEIMNSLVDIVTLSMMTKDGYIKITVNLPEPLAAAQLAIKAQKLLEKYVIDFKTKKVQANLLFIQGSYLKAKDEFEKAQVKLTMANDRSKGFISGIPQIETDRLQTQYTITFSVYQELARQFEQAKIQVKKETPIFTIIEPPMVPHERSKPQRSIVVLIWFFIGGAIGIVVIFTKDYFETMKVRLN